MNEKSTFDLLIEYPKKHGLNYATHNQNKHFSFIPSGPVINTKFVIFKKNNLFFCAYDSYGFKGSATKTFTGLYGIIDLPSEIELRALKKDMIDRFLLFNKRKTHNSRIDKVLTITSKSKNFPLHIISNKVVKHFLKIREKTNPIEIIIKNDYLQFIEEFKGKKVVGVETNYWMYKESEIDNFLHNGELLVNNLQVNTK